MTDIPHLDAFLDMLLAERAASRNTLEAYRRDIAAAAQFFKKRGVDLARAEGPDITHYLQSLKDLAPRSRARKASALRQYFRFLVSEGKRASDPMLNQESVRLSRHLPDVLSVKEMEKLLDAITSARPEDIRLKALLELAYGSGLRVSELVTLPLASYHPKRRSLLVRGKGGKERLVPLSALAHQALHLYLASRAAFLPKKKVTAKEKSARFLFPSTGREGHLTRIRFYQLLKHAAARAGVAPKKVYPHALRHAFATHILSGGADLRSLQQMLGHADIATTQIYTHLVEGHLKATVEKHHPLAKKWDSGLGTRDSGGRNR